MSTVYLMLVAFVVAPFYGQALRWRDQVKAKRIAEEHRITPHEYLAGVEERLVLSEPWPTRQTPTDLAVAYELPAPAQRVEVIDGQPEVREQDHFSIAAQVWAQQQVDRIKRILADPLGSARDVTTAEWPMYVSLLGLTVPDYVPVPVLYADVT